MIAVLPVLLAVVGAAVWAFFRFAPIRDDQKAVRRFNLVSLWVALLLAAAWSVRTYRVMSPTVDSAWWPVVSLLGALIVVPLALALTAALRHVLPFGRRGERPRP